MSGRDALDKLKSESYASACMYTAYFDASGKDDQAVMTVAGYIAMPAQWERFSFDWRLVLAKYSVPYFHMRQFACSAPKSPFAEWKDKPGTRNAFIRELVDVTRSNVRHSFGAT